LHAALDTNGYSKNSLISLIAYGNGALLTILSEQSRRFHKKARSHFVLWHFLQNAGKMPGFAEDCEPALQCTFAERLSKETIDDLAQYVLDEAEIDWQDWR
jgi:hypothetical protein